MHIDKPHCWPDGEACPNNCAAAMHDRLIYGTCDLWGPWAGWRIRGRMLISPAGDRVSCGELAPAMMFARYRGKAVAVMMGEEPPTKAVTVGCAHTRD